MNPEEYRQLERLGETHWWFVGTRNVLYSVIEKESLPDKHILDVGCGSGLMMKRLSDTGIVVGIDADHGSLRHCQDKGFERLCRGDAASLPFKSGSFGLLVATDMVEHCEDDEAVLKELNRVTAPGGTLLLSVPAYGALWSSHDVAVHHKRRYSCRSLVDKTEAAGFVTERACFFNTLLFPFAAIVKLTFGKLALLSKNHTVRYYENLGLLNRILLGIMRLEERLLDRVDLPFGLSILLIASKK